jgi:hypothetical protein
MTPRSRQAKYAAEHRWMVSRLLGAFEVAPSSAKLEGRRWYAEAEAEVRAMAERNGYDRITTAAVIAALSPQTRWRENLANADALLARKPLPSPGYQANLEKASAIIYGMPPLDVLGGPKVRSFFGNLIGAADIVTVDVWAQRAATGRDLPPPKLARYKRIARAYRQAAAIVGEHPRDFQAIIWHATRGLTEHHRDVETRKELFA